MENTFNILGIDPGTDTIGFCILTIDIHNLDIQSIKPWTEKISRYIEEDEITEIHGNKFMRLNKIKEQLSNILEIFNPTYIASEAPFYNRLKPSAYAPLVETIYVIQNTVFEWDRLNSIYLIDPITVKKSIQALFKGNKEKGEDNKDVVKIAIKKIKELNKVNFDLLDSHSIDACAVAYCQLQRIRG